MGLLQQLEINREDFNKVTKEDVLKQLEKDYPNSSRLEILNYYNHPAYSEAGKFWTKIKTL